MMGSEVVVISGWVDMGQKALCGTGKIPSGSLVPHTLKQIYSNLPSLLLFFFFFTFDCLAASNWLPGHPRSDHHVSNPHRPDYY